MNPAKEHVQDLEDTSPPHKYVSDYGEAVQSELKRISLAGRQITVSESTTQDERSLIEDAIQATQLRRKECFSNALKLWQYNHRFKYAEGFASLSTHPDLVVEHAWAMLDADKIVDLTAEFEYYYGVVISSENVLNQNTGLNLSPEGIICRRENRDFLRAEGYTR